MRYPIAPRTLAPSAGLEPATREVEALRSIPLSYEGYVPARMRDKPDSVERITYALSYQTKHHLLRKIESALVIRSGWHLSLPTTRAQAAGRAVALLVVAATGDWPFQHPKASQRVSSLFL